MKTLLDTNVIIRHLTGDPADLAQAATAFLSTAADLVLVSVIAAETVSVLESYYRASRPTIATALRALIAMDSVSVQDQPTLLRSLDLYEHQKMDFADAYLVAFGAAHGISAIASFDKGIDRAKAVQRIDPSSAAV